jgi:hypothetical protein
MPEPPSIAPAERSRRVLQLVLTPASREVLERLRADGTPRSIRSSRCHCDDRRLRRLLRY